MSVCLHLRCCAIRHLFNLLIYRNRLETEVLERLKECFTFNWTFWFALTGAMLIPKLYEMNRIWLVGAMDLSSLAIVEQYRFVDLAIEVVNESIPIAVLSIVSQATSVQRALPTIKSAALLVGGVSCVLMFSIMFGASFWVEAIGTSSQIVDVTKSYLRIRSLGLVFDSLALVALMSLKGQQKSSFIILLTVCTVLTSVLVDNLLYGNSGLSLGLGIEGVAYGYVIAKGIFFGMVWLALLNVSGCRVCEFIALKRSSFKLLIRIGKYTGADSLVRNLFYGCTLVLLNSLGANEFAGYGLSMSIMWSALIPVLALAEQTNVAVGAAYATGQKSMIYETLLSSLLVLFIVSGMLLLAGNSWNVFATKMNTHAEIVAISRRSYELLLVPYVLFTINVVLKSVFIGTGETKYILLTTMIVGSCVSLPGLLLFKADFWHPNFDDVILFLGAGFIADFMCTLVFTKRLLARM